MKAGIALTQTLDFGPAMSALSERRRSFVVAWHNCGGKNATEAGRAAGYADGEGLKVTVCRLLQDPNIQAAVIEYAKTRFVSDLPGTLDIINDIAYNPQHKDRLAAAKLKLHHAGMIEKTMVEHAGTVTLSFEQKIERYKALLEQTGGEPDKAIAPFIEAEFTEVPEEEPPLW